MIRVLIAALALAVSGAVVSPAVLAIEAAPELDVLVTDGRGVPLAGALVETVGGVSETDHWGRVRVVAVAGDLLEIDHPRFGTELVVWDGAPGRLVVPLGADLVRAIHLTGYVPGTARWDELLALADSTAVNSFMLDFKDESGFVFAETNVAMAHQVGAALERWDLGAVVDELHSHDLELVVRIVTFQDPVAGNARPEIAVQTAAGVPFTRRGLTFLDPTDLVARDYALDLAEEACSAGVDEVQFDYVRYPDGDRSGLTFDGGSDEPARVETIRSFLAEAKSRIAGECRVAADIFGFITSIPGDGGIGQHLETLAAVVDVLSPMAYPNHWGAGWFGYAEPADHPGGVIDASMRDAIVRTGGISALRPWLQDFGGYGPAEVRAQIEAADALGLGWMLWNAGSVFTEQGIPGDGELLPAATIDSYSEVLPASGFYDVPDSSAFSADVRWLGEQAITTGCNPPWRDAYCPDRPLTRAQAATMLVRALGLAASSVDKFDDDTGSVHEADINALAAAGITRGCAVRSYCPEDPLTRAQMASLLVRALELAFSIVDRFDDDTGSVHEADINSIAAAGITRGCSDTTYCPEDHVLRDQIAAFLRRALE